MRPISQGLILLAVLGCSGQALAGGNLLPTANPDTASAMASGLPIGGNVITNDDQGDAPATVTSVNGSAANVDAEITTALGGTLQLFANGTWNYTPPGTDITPPSEDDVVTYDITDSNADTSSSTLTITVFPDYVPVAYADVNSATEGGSDATGNVLTDGPTPDDLGDAPTTLTASQGGNPIALGTPFVTAQGGTFTLNGDGSYAYTPPAQGSVPPAGLSDVIEYLITDNDLDNSSSILTITVADNDLLPVANDDTYAATEQGADVVGNVLTDGTPDDLGDTPTAVTAAAQGGSPLTLGVAYATAAGGTLTLNGDGTFSYTPPALGNVPIAGASDAFTYTITDADGDDASATLTFTLTDGNQYINELLIEMPGKDLSREYLEFRGAPGSVIPAGTYFVAIEGDRQQVSPGRIVSTIRLDGLTFGASTPQSPYGFLVLLPFNAAYAPQVNPAATLVQSTASGFAGLPDNRWSGGGTTNYERPTTSYFLVRTGTAPVVDFDIDTNNDGMPETNPETLWTVLDSVAGADHPQDRTYARINFRKGGVSSVGTTVQMNFRPGYFGRFGDSLGSAPGDWVSSTQVAGSYPNWTLPANVIPAGLATKPLNHIGAVNAYPNVAPVNNVPGTQTTNEDTPIVFSAGNGNLISITDPDTGGNAIRVTITIATGTFSLSGTAGLSFVTGDGTSDATMEFTGSLASVNAALAGARYTPPAEYFGPSSLTITTNDQGNTGTDGPKSDTDVVQINVVEVDDVPDAVDDAFSTPEETPLTGTVRGNDTGLGDTPVEFELETGAANGVATVDTAGGYTYSPNINFSGIDQFTYRVTDDDGQFDVATVTITVTPVNDTAPDARDDAVTIDEDASASGSVAANDVPGVDAPFTFARVSAATNGTATVAANGAYTYTPNAHFNGTDSFTYSLTDVDGQSDVATVTITVTALDDGDPDAVADNATTNEGVAASGNVGTNDLNTVDAPITYARTTQASNGTATVAADGSFTYTPNANFSGTDSFTYTVTDVDGDSDTATVTITVTNVDDDAPTADDQSVTTPFETPVTITLTGNDPEGATLVFAIGTGPSNGTLGPLTGATVTYTPDDDYDGPDSFTFTVSDGTNPAVTGTVSITVQPSTNATPVAVDDAFNAVINMPLVVAAPGVLQNDTDAEMDTLTALVGTLPSSGTLVLAPNGGFTYTPATGFLGNVTFTYTVTDGTSTSAPATVTINVGLDQLFADGFENPPPPAVALAAVVKLVGAGAGTTSIDLAEYGDAVSHDTWAAVAVVGADDALAGAVELRRGRGGLEARLAMNDGGVWRYGAWTAVRADARLALGWVSVDGAGLVTLAFEADGARASLESAR